MAKRRFEAQRATIDRELKAVMAKMGATGCRVDTDITEADTSVNITFDRNGKRYTFRCDKWEHPSDNYRAAQLTISQLYSALEVYGTTRQEAETTYGATRDRKRAQADADFDQLFGMFMPMPDSPVLALGDGTADWWEVLQIPRSSGKAAIANAYKALARIHHPDQGGEAAAMKRLNAAYVKAVADADRRQIP